MAIQSTNQASLRNLDALARLMDSQFKIPGTNIRFGFDALIGLVPGVGDFSTFLVSGAMLMMLAKNGASGYILTRMVLNITLDALVGSIPVLGDIFDVAFKANQRNMRLMHEHYVEGRHKGGAWKLLIPLLVALLVVVGGIVWGSYELLSWLFHLMF